MTYLVTRFFDAARSTEMFASKSLILQNAAAYEQHIEGIIDKHATIVTPIAKEFLLSYTNGDLRKNGITPRHFHEYGHVDTLDKIITVYGHRWIDPQKYGSIDALLAAAILHDMREDHDLPSNKIRRHLESNIDILHRQGHISHIEHEKAYDDINKTIEIVDLLSRKQGKLLLQGEDRIEQANQWLKHPYAYLIKQIDWADKLSTMIGVEHFEKNNFSQMNVVLSETALIFVKEQQNKTADAIAAYPHMKPIYNAMEGILGMAFQGLRTYCTTQQGTFSYAPRNAKPFNFSEYKHDSQKLIRSMFRGNNYISPIEDDLEMAGLQNEKVRDLLDKMYRPALESIYAPRVGNLVQSFSQAVASYSHHTLQRLMTAAKELRSHSWKL